MLLVFAHPDDESFSCGGVVSKYVENGWQVSLICATHGEAGSSGPYFPDTPAALGAIRERELADAAKILGISQVIFLGYRDGKLKGVTEGELEDALYKKLVEISPDVVITFDTSGVSNHPDHIRICYSTTYAFQRYAGEISETREFVKKVTAGEKGVKKRHFLAQHKLALRQEAFADVVDDGIEPKLYYVCLPESVIEFMKKAKLIPEIAFDKPWRGTPDKFITTVIDCKRYKGVKIKALKSHVTQEVDVNKFVEFENNPFLIKEFFILRMVGNTEVYMGKNDRVSDRL